MPKEQTSLALTPELAGGTTLETPGNTPRAALNADGAAELPPAQALSAAVDALAFPMMALQADGVLLHANLAAQDLLDAGEYFVLSAQGQVWPKPAAERADFVAALLEAASGQRQQLMWAQDSITVHATLRPLGPAVDGAPGLLVLLMLAPPADTVFDASGLATTYGLSVAETRVLEALLHGGHAQSTAKRLGVGVATVRSQIAAIRKKTGHDSVASLLAALGDLPPLRKLSQPPIGPRQGAAKVAKAAKSPKDGASASAGRLAEGE